MKALQSVRGYFFSIIQEEMKLLYLQLLVNELRGPLGYQIVLSVGIGQRLKTLCFPR